MESHCGYLWNSGSREINLFNVHTNKTARHPRFLPLPGWQMAYIGRIKRSYSPGVFPQPNGSKKGMGENWQASDGVHAGNLQPG